MGGYPYDYPLPPTQTNEVAQNSGANMTDPIAVPADLNEVARSKGIREDKKEIVEAIRK